MFDHKQYIPCLRWKMGEYQAVLRLSDTAKKTITPLIEVPEFGWDFEKGEQAKTIDEHLTPFSKRVRDKWGKSPCFVDMNLIFENGSERMQKGMHPVKFIFDNLRDMQCFAIPVTGLDRGETYQQEIKKTLTKNKSSICFRITIEQAAKNSFKRSLDSLLSELEIRPNDANFVLDLVTPNFVPLDGFVKVIQVIIGRLPYLKDWRTFSIIGTSFPETMGGIRQGIEVVPRYEWQLYKKLIATFTEAKLRLPSFGDYAISHPNVLKMDMRRVKPSATIRYTIDDSWCLVKGKNVKDFGLTQFYELSHNLANSRHYFDSTFSYGDKYIKDCADKKVGNGNLTTWRQVGTNHHIEKVTCDIANFYASLKSA
jgi:hypothetical protein